MNITLQDLLQDRGNEDGFTNPVTEKYILKSITQLKEEYGIAETAAMQVLGYYLKENKSYDSVKDVINFIEIIKKKPKEALKSNELNLLVALGFLRRKKLPFESKSGLIGRNELCPCGSGLKYKKCCLELAKASDLERYRHE